jgi:hypothetical protein
VPDDPVQHDVDMEAYDAALIESGLFEFVDDLDEDETTLTFLAEPEPTHGGRASSCPPDAP